MIKFTKAMAIIMMMVATIIITGCNKPTEPNNGGNDANDTIANYEYVDLGLPSGTLWATCNVGANTSEECGDYFAWGETSPKAVYDWKSYKYGGMVNEHFVMTKYCADSCSGLNGFVDSLTVLEYFDDAVTSCWGTDWRMPTKEEWDELYRNTTCTTTIQNGVEGRLLTGVNGNSIFLPATGFCLEGDPICLGLGVYWTSSVHTDYPERAWSFHYDLDECHVCGTYERNRGQCVRAVRAAR